MINPILLRAVIEFSSRCFRSCHYCPMRRENLSFKRRSLTVPDVLAAAGEANELGINTVMLQGGDDFQFPIKDLQSIVHQLTITNRQTVLLCIGDRSVSDYSRLFDAGASQAIVKFESSNPVLYRRFRPHSTLTGRVALIWKLSKIGYRMSSGFILGLPGSTENDVQSDLDLTSNLPLFAASVSPFISDSETPLRGYSAPTLQAATEAIRQLRLRKPHLLIPAVSALNLLHPRPTASDCHGQLLGLTAGANVLTANFTPPQQRSSYRIYSSGRSIVTLATVNELSIRCSRPLVSRLDLDNLGNETHPAHAAKDAPPITVPVPGSGTLSRVTSWPASDH